MNDVRIPKFEYLARSYWLLVFFSLFELAILRSIYFEPFAMSLWLIASALLFISFNVTTVTVQADREVILITFGIGFIQKSVYVSDIVKLRMRPNNTFFALYAGSADQALEITERSGRTTLVGIGDTRKMLEFFRGHARGE